MTKYLVAVDGGGSFYVIDYDLDRIAILDPSGSLVSTIGLSGDGPGQPAPRAEPAADGITKADLR